MKFFSPLEQFMIHPIIKINFLNLFDISLTNNTLSIIVAMGSFIFLSYFFTYKIALLPYATQIFGEILYFFIFNIVFNQVGFKGLQYFPLIFTTFNFILFCNLLGLIPFNFTATAQIMQLFTLSLSFILSFVIIGFLRHKIGFLKLFVPKNVPIFLVPLIVVVEVLSYCLRPISLSVRLFANMLAGHTLLHIIAGFGIKIIKKSFIIGIIPFIFIMAIICLELAIAFIQAYVFTMLITIYLNESIQEIGH